MKSKSICLTLAFTGLAGAVLWQAGSAAADNKKDQAQIKRGEYLVAFGGCDDCHSPKIFTEAGPQPDPGRRLSGHPADNSLPALPKGVIGEDGWGALTTNDLTAWYGPWGVSFTRNLTPDMETGLGKWTDELFINTMRTGKHLGTGRDLLPPMPWYTLGALTDEDLKAIFSYLGTLKPIHNKVPDPIPPQE